MCLRAALAARFLILVQAVLDAVGETGGFDDAVGAAVKKSGLMDTLVEWGRKLPGGKKVVQAVEDRVDAALMKLGMDFESLNLLPAYRDDMIGLTEALNSYTDEEAAELVKELAQNVELTGTDIGDTVKQKVSEGIVQRVTAKGYGEIQVRDAVQDLESHQFDLEKVADHIIERVIDRQVSAGGIDDAIRNPLKTLPVKYDDSGRPSYKVIGKAATVSINPDTGRMITVYPTHKNLAEKLIKEGEK